MPVVSYSLDSYRYFKEINGETFHGNILDFGSNYGCFLASSKGIVNHKNYTGVDVDKEALDVGQSKFPNAKFIHYNRYNPMYNQLGIPNCWPDVDDSFDFIVSYSVLTHTTQEDMIDIIKWLYSKLKSKGKMFITYNSLQNAVAKKFFFDKRVADFGYCDEIDGHDYLYLIDNKITKTSKNGMFVSFYDNQYLLSLLKSYDVKLTESKDVTGKCFQDCIIIKKSN